MTRDRWDCQRKGCWKRARWDPATLDGLLPRGASFGDCDAWAEIGGRFLFIEHKGQGAPMENGQRRALLALARLPGCTVWVIRPRADGWERLDMGAPDGFRPITWDEFTQEVRRWGSPEAPGC